MQLVHGECPRGADKQADSWVWDMLKLDFHIDVEPHPADWAKWGRGAGYRRSAEMVKRGADVCLAFIKNHSPGSTYTAELAQKAGIHTLIFRE